MQMTTALHTEVSDALSAERLKRRVEVKLLWLTLKIRHLDKLSATVAQSLSALMRRIWSMDEERGSSKACEVIRDGEAS